MTPTRADESSRSSRRTAAASPGLVDDQHGSRQAASIWLCQRSAAPWRRPSQEVQGQVRHMLQMATAGPRPGQKASCLAF